MSSYRTLFEIGKVLIAETNISKLLPLAMDKVIEETKAQRGIITVFGKDGELLFETARNFRKQDIENPEFEISKTIIQSVLETGRHLVIQNALAEPKFAESSSIGRLRVLSVAGAPLRLHNEVFGVIYIDNRDVAAMFDEGTGRLLSEFAELIAVAVKNALDRRQLIERQHKLQMALDERIGYGELIGRSPAMQEVFKLIDKVAGKDITVLITGETGTGKELVARELQRRSSRHDQEFVAFSCANLPENLLESELFGHEKGAFTGADRRKRGLFEIADGGTMFLDEISEMNPAIQAKLLRFLQSGEFKPLGAEVTKRADVRMIVASNRNLSEMIAQGQFREDLYYRLNVIEIKLPPLRERGEDILLIAEYFLKRFARQFNSPVRSFSPAARELLLQHTFPGNVRELENLVLRAIVLAEGDTIEADDLAITKSHTRRQVPTFVLPSVSLFNQAKQELIERFEREFIRVGLQATNGNISEAARRAGMHKKNFIQKMQQYGIKREDFLGARAQA
ncbi:MAG: sigma-54-dependent Fis family transcriptional regulator [candidate division KSB1 bacterium]|nr:sigma-54-dependent Fis family transcriptional regulator [candidate division KSB1 bacterium]